MSALISLGGYGSFIWPSYILTTLILGALSWVIIRRNLRAKRQLKDVENLSDQPES